MHKVFEWLVKSSQNPAQVSLTIKGLLTLYIPIIILALKFLGHDVPSSTLEQIVSSIGDIIIAALGFVGTVVTAYGFLRKLVSSFKK